MSSRRLAMLVCAAFLTAPGSAAAAALPVGVNAGSLDVAMSADGAAHVAWLTRDIGAPGGDYKLNVCRIPAGGNTCTQTLTPPKVLPYDGGATGPWIFSVGGTNRVTAVAGNSDGANDGTYATTSAGGLATYGSLEKVAPITAADVEIAPSGNRLYVASKERPFATSSAADDASFSSGPVPGMGSDSNSSALLETGPFDGTDQQVGIRPGGQPLVNISNFAEDEVYSYSYNGALANNAQLNTAAQWSARTPFGLGSPFERNGSYETASGFNRLWFGYEALDTNTEILVRRYGAAGFGPAINPDCGVRRSDAGSQDAPALAVGPTGLLHIAYTNANDGILRLNYFVGTEDGSAFSPYQELYGGPDPQRDVEIAADPSGVTPGIVVWTSDTGGTGGPLKFSRLPAATPAACPPPVGGGTPPGGGGTTPVTTTTQVKPPVTVQPVKAKAIAIADVVKGLPSTKRCVSRRSFKIRLQNPKGTTIKSASVRVNGKVKATRKGGRVIAPVNLKGLPKGSYTVKIAITLTNGKTVNATRKYRTCTPKRKRR